MPLVRPPEELDEELELPELELDDFGFGVLTFGFAADFGFAAVFGLEAFFGLAL